MNVIVVPLSLEDLPLKVRDFNITKILVTRGFVTWKLDTQRFVTQDNCHIGICPSNLSLRDMFPRDSSLSDMSLRDLSLKDLSPRHCHLGIPSRDLTFIDMPHRCDAQSYLPECRDLSESIFHNVSRPVLFTLNSRAFHNGMPIPSYCKHTESNWSTGLPCPALHSLDNQPPGSILLHREAKEIKRAGHGEGVKWVQGVEGDPC